MTRRIVLVPKLREMAHADNTTVWQWTFIVSTQYA